MIVAEYLLRGRWLTAIGAEGETFEELAAGIRRQFPDVTEVRKHFLGELEPAADGGPSPYDPLVEPYALEHYAGFVPPAPNNSDGDPADDHPLRWFVRCLNCGYHDDLTNVDADGPCPDCGLRELNVEPEDEAA